MFKIFTIMSRQSDKSNKIIASLQDRRLEFEEVVTDLGFFLKNVKKRVTIQKIA